MVSSVTTSIRPSAEAMDRRVSIPGVTMHRLAMRVDGRGALTEIFRSSWDLGTMHQWTALTLGRRVVRGPSVHRRHTDAVITLDGLLEIGLRDLREQSIAFQQTSRLVLPGTEPTLVVIPPGVMHAFYSPIEPTLVVVGNTREFDPDDDIKCRWQDVALDLDESVVGTQDDRARPLDEVIAALRQFA
jgi:dTDP-4-dehydrorhamnose 3,5-epimerase